MVQQITLILTFSFIMPSFAQVRWSGNTAIAWSNFKGVPEQSNNLKALTHTSLSMQYNCNKRCIYYKVEAVFNEHDSWVADPTDILLVHEQDHFNIQEIFARKIRKYLQECFKNNTPGDTIHVNVDRLTQECSRYQARYDSETDHSRNSRRQKAWSDKISSQLHSLKQYADTEFSNCVD